MFQFAIITWSETFQLKNTTFSSGHKCQCLLSIQSYFSVLTCKKTYYDTCNNTSFSSYYSSGTTTSSCFCSTDPVNMPTSMLRYFLQCLTTSLFKNRRINVTHYTGTGSTHTAAFFRRANRSRFIDFKWKQSMHSCATLIYTGSLQYPASKSSCW